MPHRKISLKYEPIYLKKDPEPGLELHSQNRDTIPDTSW